MIALISSATRRLWPLLIVGVAVVLLIFTSRHRPVDVTAHYVIGSDRAQVESLSVTWLGENDKEVRAQFNYQGRDVPRTQDQTMNIPPGQYDVTIILSLRDQTSRAIERRIEIEGEGVVEIDLSD